MKLVFVHGWGFDESVWNLMTPEFQEHDCYQVNLGFIGEEKLNVPPEKFIGIGHSLGGLWLLKHYPEQMNGFVSIASFNCFYEHIPHQILNKMQRNMLLDMNAQLQEFWHHAGLDHPEGFKNINAFKMIEGLIWLSQWKAAIPENLPVKVLASRDDQIVPESMSEAVWKNHNIEWSEDGGHILPLTKPEWCIEKMKDFIDALK